MNDLPPQLRQAFERDLRRIPSDESALQSLITYSDALRGYYLLVEYFAGGEPIMFGLREPGLLESAVCRHVAGFGGTRKWSDPKDVAATLFLGLTKNHPFLDGNKRLALLMLLVSLRRNGLWIKGAQADWESLTVAVASSSLRDRYRKDYDLIGEGPDKEVRFISTFIRKNTRRIEGSGYRSLTFKELDARIRQHGYELDEPSGNKISVFRVQKSGLLFWKKSSRIRLGTVGYPGDKKQVSRGDLKRVRELCQLTRDYGIDDSVFFEGTEPMYHIISEFEGPLRRLKDK
jgi:death-on-curing protein